MAATDFRNGYYITLSLSLHSTTLKIVFRGVAFPFSYISDHDREEAGKFEYPKNESVALPPPQRLRLGFSSA